MPPMPGQSRSLLQFNPNIKEEFNVNDNTVDKKVPALDNIKQEPMNGKWSLELNFQKKSSNHIFLLFGKLFLILEASD